MVAALKAGDVVVVNKLDRLGRSTRELLDLIHRIDKAGASFRSLGDPLWDTGSAQGRLLLTEGRRRAMANGRQVRPKAKAISIPAVRGFEAPRQGRNPCRDFQVLCVSISMISRL
jgi:hypothetical protein